MDPSSDTEQKPVFKHRAVSELKPSPENARTHSPEQIEKIKASIQAFGFLNPVIISKDNLIIAGHGRWEAAKAIGLQTIPTMRADHLTDVQRRAYMLADNRIADDAGYDEAMLSRELKQLFLLDFDLGLTGFEDDELAELLNPRANLTDEDTAPEPPAIPRAQLGETWLLGKHRVRCGDSTNADDVKALMGGARCDCVFTSPPYAVGIDYGPYKDTIENLRNMLPILANLWKGIIINGGFAVLNFGDILSGKEIAGTDTVCEYPMALEYFPVFIKCGYTLWSRRIWCKPGAAVGSSRHCIGTNRAASNFEHIWTWKLPGTPPVNDQISGDYPSQAGWFDTSRDNQLDIGLKVHGAGMPVSVARRSIIWNSRPGKIIHEPFCGTGTTIIAAETESRICYGMELNPGYIDVIIARWQQFTGQKATRESDGILFDDLKPKAEAA